MKTTFRFLTKLLILFWLLCTLAVVIARPKGYDQTARQILEAAGVKGGFKV